MNIEQIKQMEDRVMGTAMLAVVSAEVRLTKSQSEFLSITFSDKTGVLKGKIWDWSGDAPLPGTLWDMQFEYSPFKNSPQVVVREYQEVDKSKVDAGLFIDSLSQDEFKFYHEELKDIINSIKDKPLRDFVADVVYKHFPEFTSSVGAKLNHHGRLGGLMQHSVRVTRNAQSMANAYKGTPTFDLIDMDLLLAGAILHDLSKVGEYTTENLIIDHTLEGTLTRHYDTGPAYLMEAYLKSGEPISRERLLGLTHIAVTHHGIEFSEKPPSTITAWLIHGADLVDCFVDALEGHMDGTISPDKLWVLGNKVVDERDLN